VAERQLSRFAAIILLLSTIPGVAVAAPGRTAVLTNLEVDGFIDGDVVVFGADLILGENAVVTGDAVAVGGDLRVAEGAAVGRHAVAVFGQAEVPKDADVGGRVLSFASLASLGQGSATTGRSLRVTFAMRLLTSGGWLLVTTGLAFLFPIRMRYGAWAVPVAGLKIPALGLLVGLTVVASLVAALGLGPGLGVPLVAALMVAFIAAKAIGLTVIGCFVGNSVLGRWIHHPLPISLEVFVGVMVLLAVRFLPLVGDTMWNLISLFALGASIAVIGVPAGTVRPEPSHP
jgi:hypothetical protein